MIKDEFIPLGNLDENKGAAVALGAGEGRDGRMEVKRRSA